MAALPANGSSASTALYASPASDHETVNTRGRTSGGDNTYIERFTVRDRGEITTDA